MNIFRPHQSFVIFTSGLEVDEIFGGVLIQFTFSRAQGVWMFPKTKKKKTGQDSSAASLKKSSSSESTSWSLFDVSVVQPPLGSV